MLDEKLSNLEYNINAYDMQGYALIHWAAYYGYTECFGILIKHGAYIFVLLDLLTTTLYSRMYLLSKYLI